MTLLEKYCEIKGWQGATIHQVFEDFKSLNLKEQDRVCGKLIDSMRDISDYKKNTMVYRGKDESFIMLIIKTKKGPIRNG